jgi:hypothetical protein
LQNPENEWSVEDAFIWYENGQFYCLAKDFQGYFTKSGKNQVALFQSDNATDWHLSENPLGFCRKIVWENGETEQLANMERPQIMFENGKARVLMCACVYEDDKNRENSFNIRIPLK